MSKIKVQKKAIFNNNLDTGLVTINFVNTHCIVCGKGFDKGRVGKLYCSARCKQFGYNHKNEINEALEVQGKGIKHKPVIFSLEDFAKYNKLQKMLRRFRDLDKKRQSWESANQELYNRKKLDIPISNYLFDTYSSKELTQEEEGDMYSLENDIDERIIDLKPKELSLEQWSFIKSLYPSLDEISFFELVCSLSNDFLSQLTFGENSANKNFDNLLIKNKFINHCNLIAAGVIKFEANEQKELD